MNIFRNLDNLKCRLNFYIVLYEDDALFVTTDDKVYGCGLNKTGLLGLGHKNPMTREPNELTELSGKKVINISYGWNHVLALTDCGDIYSWGSNKYGQLGIDSIVHCLTPTLVCQPYSYIKFGSIYCGPRHNYAIAKNGQVLGWGSNHQQQLCIRYPSNKLVPQIVIRLERYFVISFSIGGAHSLALTDHGDLLIFTKKMNWRIFQLDSIGCTVVGIACGEQHSLLLTEKGEVYALGSNKHGQIGCETKPDVRNSCIPIKVKGLDEPCSSIGTHHTSNLSIALSQYSQTCYVWGELVDEKSKVWKPRKTTLRTINSAFQQYSDFQCSPFLVYKFEIDQQSSEESNSLETLKFSDRISDRVTTLFDDPAHSDLQFIIDGRVINVHRLILKLNSVYFDRLLSAGGQWSELDAIEISDYSFPIYYKYLQYLYTGQLTPNSTDCLGLLELALDCEDIDLQVQCIAILRTSTNISDDSCRSLYQLVVRFGLNTDHLLMNQFKSFIIDYADKHSIDLNQDK